MPVGVVADLRIKAGMETAFEMAFGRYQQTVRDTEQGVVYFGLHRSRTVPDRYVVMERYCDEAALQAHRLTPHYQAIPATLGGFLAGPPDIQVFDAIE